ncbi:lantibiotic dehydratase [Streptomyces sp. NPDC054863]
MGLTDKPSLFTPLTLGLLRAPVLPAPSARPASCMSDEGPGRLRETVLALTADPLIAEALALSSPSLAERIDRLRDGRPATAAGLRRCLRAVLRYRARMTARTTPFGLMAGVAQIRFGPDDEVRVRLGGEHRKSVRPDAGWLAELAARWERQPAVIAGLRLSANGLCVRRGDRLVLPYVTGATGGPRTDEISVRHTEAVRAAMDGARLPVAHAALTARVRACLTDPPPGAVEGVIAELVARSFLLTDLPPAPDAPDPLRHITATLSRNPAASDHRALLGEVAAGLDAYAARPPGKGLGTLRSTRDRMRALQPHERPVTTDLLLDTDVTLPRTVAHEAARAAALLWRLGPPAGSQPPLGGYRERFLHRYGTQVPVPLAELLDPVAGLGAPELWGGFPAPGVGPTEPRTSPGKPRAGPAEPEARRDRALLALAEEAVLGGRDEITLTDADLASLGEHAGEPPPSAEAVFHLLADSPDALADGSFTLVMSPLTGTWPAGALWGRFAPMLPEADRRFRELATTALTGGPDATGEPPIAARLLFHPRDPRAGNVARVPRWVDHTLATGTFGERSDPGSLSLDDVAVVATSDRLRMVSLRHGGRELVAATFHMLNTAELAPAHVRLAQLITADGMRPLSCWDWGAARDWPFLPAVRHGRTVLSRARWLVRDPAVLDAAADTAHWLTALRAWQQRWRVPQRIEAGTHDQRLPLDLSRADDRALLREELRRHPGTELQEQLAPDGAGFGWLTGPSGGPHTAEISVPLLRGTTPGPAPGPEPIPYAATLPQANSAPVRHLPGSAWLYAQLYCPGAQQDVVLIHHLPRLLDVLPAEVDRWFFVRYADPAPHLRLRLHGEPRTLTGPVLADLHDLVADLIRQKLVERLALDTYVPEEARYGGGPDAMAAAERVFHADSAAALAHLRLLDVPSSPIDAVLLAAAGQAHLAFHFVRPDDSGDASARARQLLAMAPRTADHASFREHRRKALLLINPFDGFAALRALPGTAPLLDAWAARAAAERDYRGHLSDEGPGPESVLASLLHMHHNRVAATPSRLPENTVFALARGAVEAHLARQQAETATGASEGLGGRSR